MPRFEAAPAPTRAELRAMLERIYARVTKWLARKGFLREPDASNAPPEMTPTEAVTIEAMARGTLDTVRDGGDALASEKAASEPPPTSDAVTYERFNLHAAVALAAHDDLGRERLCRYLTRPPFALGRLQQRRDGTAHLSREKGGTGTCARACHDAGGAARAAGGHRAAPALPALAIPWRPWSAARLALSRRASGPGAVPVKMHARARRGEPKTARESALRRRPCRARRRRRGGYRCADRVGRCGAGGSEYPFFCPLGAASRGRALCPFVAGGLGHRGFAEPSTSTSASARAAQGASPSAPS